MVKLGQWRGLLCIGWILYMGGLCMQGEAKATPRGDSVLSMEDAVLYREGALRPQSLHALQLMPEGRGYSYIDIEAGEWRSFLWDKKGASPKGVVTLKQLNALLETLEVEPCLRWPRYSWRGERVEFWVGRYFVRVNDSFTQGEVIFTLPEEGVDNIHVSPEGSWVQYNVGERIELLNQEGKVHVVVNDTAQGIVNGRAVHQYEFGINGGIFWSPDGRRLAFYHMDESMVGEYPLVDVGCRMAELRSLRYPMAGRESHHVKVGIYDVDRETLTWVQHLGEAEDYRTNITWSPDGNYLYIAEINRGQDWLRMNRFHAQDGRLDRTLFEERDEHYIDPQCGVYLIPQGKGDFLWLSQRSGHNHLYRYAADGTLRWAVTEGTWDIEELLGVDAGGKYAYVMSTEGAVLERHLYRVSLKKGGRRERLTTQAGVNRVKVSLKSEGSGGSFVSFWTRHDDAGGVYAGSLMGRKSEVTLLRSTNPLAEIAMPIIEHVTITAADGVTPLYGRLVRPRDIAPGAKLPVVVYVYGGPHVQLVTDQWLWGAAYWELLMAQRGYVVFVLDSRGSAGRGFAFEQVIHRRLGEVEVTDQLEGIRYLKKLPYIDTGRMGVHGWSYGGFMTLNLLLRSEANLQVGVAGGPVIDWHYYEIMYGERYMDRPQENEEGYARTSLLHYAHKLKGRRLLLLHGYQDPVVLPQHTLRFMEACVKAGEYTVDSYWYVGHEHNVRGADRVHLMNRITDYFDTYLKSLPVGGEVRK